VLLLLPCLNQQRLQSMIPFVEFFFSKSFISFYPNIRAKKLKKH